MRWISPSICNIFAVVMACLLAECQAQPPLCYKPIQKLFDNDPGNCDTIASAWDMNEEHSEIAGQGIWHIIGGTTHSQSKISKSQISTTVTYNGCLTRGVPYISAGKINAATG